MPDPHPDPSTAVFVCDNVHVHGRPILFVSHESDGSWQFLCGGQHDDDSSDGVALACWEHAIALDEQRGYYDIDPERAWEQWQEVRSQK